MKPETYYKKLQKKPTINQTLKKGTSHATIQDTQTTNTQETNKIKQTLLKKLVKDQQIINILTEDQNFNKLANRLDYKLTIKGQTITNQETTLATAETQGKTLQQTIQEINQNIHKGEKTRKDYEDKIIKRLKQYNWYNTETQQEGYITKTTLTITLRKG